MRDIVRRMLSEAGGGAAFQFPVGAVYINVTGTNPNTELGYGTWVQYAAGAALVGYSGVAPFNVAEAAIGNATHDHDYSDVIDHDHAVNVINSVHSHTVDIYSALVSLKPGIGALQAVDEVPDATFPTSNDATSVSASTDPPAGSVATGTTDAASSLPPSIVVFIWKRTV